MKENEACEHRVVAVNMTLGEKVEPWACPNANITIDSIDKLTATSLPGSTVVIKHKVTRLPSPLLPSRALSCYKTSLMKKVKYASVWRPMEIMR